MSVIKKYIIVDDDPENNFICKIMLEMVLGNVDIQTFEEPEEGLAFIENEYPKTLLPSVLFLDINMPSITGWQFMTRYEKLNANVKKQVSIYILSSSIDQRDKERAKANKWIKGFISKPLSREVILSIVSQANSKLS